LGARALTIRKLEDFDSVAEEIARTAGPLVLDIRLDPTHNLVF
jgi:thiamine pyrophosphate-dependent acetolactate synthase large subunit-like protein